jgi:hypothetical protein
MLIREAVAEELDDEIVVLVRFVMMEPNGLKKGVLREMLTEAVPKKAERLMSMVEQCTAEWFAEAILRGMTRRFGPVAETYRQRVMDASQDELEEWICALGEGRTLEEMFSPPPSN